jgi:hypothetical protein
LSVLSHREIRQVASFPAGGSDKLIRYSSQVSIAKNASQHKGSTILTLQQHLQQTLAQLTPVPQLQQMLQALAQQLQILQKALMY